MATIYAVVSPHNKIHIKTEVLSPHSTTRAGAPQRPLRPVNKTAEPGKARRQLAMNINKGGPVINNRRNARERNRVKQVNQGFAVLRAHLPTVEKSRKVSKVDTLRGAIDYIQGLSELLASAPAPRYEPPPPYGYRADVRESYPVCLAPPPPRPDRPGFSAEPPPYRETLRELRHHQQLQLGDRPPDTELLRWWPVSSPPPP